MEAEMGSDFDKKLRKAVLSVGRRKMVDRIIAVIRHCKGEHVEERSDHMRVKGETTLNIGGGPAKFTVRSYGQFHEYTKVQAYYGGSLMFEAVHGGWQIPADVDPRRVIHAKDGSITVVGTFRPGLWMKLLSVKWLIRQEERRKRQEGERLARLKLAKSEPVRESDRSLAQRFALESPGRLA